MMATGKWRLLGLALLLATELLAAARPNIVLVLADDQGYGDYTFMGNPVLQTPNLDKLAADGVVLKRFYVSPVCTPTRASLMTGRYSFRTRAIDTFRGRAMMDTAEVTIAELLSANGYGTGIFGKWHLGDSYPLRPMDQGFQEVLVFRGGGLAQPSEPLANHKRYTDPILFHNGEQVQTKGFCTDVYFDAAMAYMEREVAAKQPFFIYLATNAPHGPFDDVPEAAYKKYLAHPRLAEVAGKGKPDTVARAYSMVENIDDNIGRLQAKLAALGIADNTLVLYMSDNGPSPARYTAGLRGAKTDPDEGGIRSPLILNWPGVLKAQTDTEHVAGHVDIWPTLLAVAGVEKPAELKIDGVNLWPWLKSRADADWPEHALFMQAHRGDVPVAGHNFAVVTSRWKLVRNSGFGRESPAETAPVRLHDLLADPGEQSDLAAQHPEVVKQLSEKYDAWFADVSSTRPDNYAPPRMVIGTDHERVTWLTLQDLRAEGPGWGTSGRWLLNGAVADNYDITVILEKGAPAGAQVELTINGTAQLQPLVAGATTATLGNMPLPAGDIAVSASIVDGAGKRSLPYQVCLTRQ